MAFRTLVPCLALAFLCAGEPARASDLPCNSLCRYWMSLGKPAAPVDPGPTALAAPPPLAAPDEPMDVTPVPRQALRARAPMHRFRRTRVARPAPPTPSREPVPTPGPASPSGPTLPPATLIAAAPAPRLRPAPLAAVEPMAGARAEDFARSGGALNGRERALVQDDLLQLRPR